MSYPHVQQRECHCVIYLTVAGMRPLIKPSNAFEGNTVHLLLCPQTGQKQTTEKKYFLHASSLQETCCSILLIVLLVSMETDVELIKIKG